MSAGTTPGQISFADIERDLERSAFQCTNGAGGCHGGTKPTGVMKLAANASLDATALMANYMEIKARIDTTMPADQALVLQKTLVTSTVTHGGIKPFDTTQDAIYQRWLLWIKLGANFQPVPTTTGVGDM